MTTTNPHDTPRGAATTALAQELPSSRSLLRSTVIALVAALVLLVTVVLPAEYGVDPTGIGRVLGLTRMGEIKVALAKEAEAAAAADSVDALRGTVTPPTATPVATPASSPAAVPARPSGAVPTASADSTQNSHETRIAIRPGEGKEVKLVMRRGARATYSWSTDGGGVNYLTHGDTVNAPSNAYHTYARGTGTRSDEGAIVAAFDGNRGWFWRNRTNAVITVTLRTRGEYEELKQPN